MIGKPPIPQCVPRNHPNHTRPDMALKRRSTDLTSTSQSFILTKQKRARRLSESMNFRAQDLCTTQPLFAGIKCQRENSLKMVSKGDYYITLHLLSNWGATDLLTFSAIEFLTADHSPIVDVSIKLNEEDVDKCANLDHMLDHQLIKDNPEQIFTYKWTPNQEPVILKFLLKSATQPTSIRIWNGKLSPETQLKDFVAYMGNSEVCSAEVPQKFGGIFPILQERLPLLNSRPTTEKSKINQEEILQHTDEYGVLPMISTNDIKITILEAGSPKADIMGLNSIDIFDATGFQMDINNIQSVDLESGCATTSPMNLFKEQKDTMTTSEMWMVKKDYQKNNVIFHIKLARPTKIIMLRFWNYNGEDTPNRSVKKIQVSFGNKKMFMGSLKPGLGITTNMIRTTTDVWLVDSPKWKFNSQQLNIP